MSVHNFELIDRLLDAHTRSITDKETVPVSHALELINLARKLNHELQMANMKDFDHSILDLNYNWWKQKI